MARDITPILVRFPAETARRLAEQVSKGGWGRFVVAATERALDELEFPMREMAPTATGRTVERVIDERRRLAGDDVPQAQARYERTPGPSVENLRSSAQVKQGIGPVPKPGEAKRGKR